MNRFLRSTVTIVALALVSVIWPPSLRAAEPDPCLCPTNTKAIPAPADTPAALTDPNNTPQFLQRAKAATVLGACTALSEPTLAASSHHDFGQGFGDKLFGLLGYRDFCPTQTPVPTTSCVVGAGQTPAPGVNACEGDPVKKANDLIGVFVQFRQSPAGQNWQLGTDIDEPCGFAQFICDVISNYGTRNGELDVTQSVLTAVMHRYGPNAPNGMNRIDAAVFHQALSVMNLDPTLGLSYGLSTAGIATICTAKVCGLTGCLPPTLIQAAAIAACIAEVALLVDPQVTVAETENHTMNTWSSQYLAHDLLFKESCAQGACDPSHDNFRNGMRGRLLNPLAGFLQKDFLEYNAHNYQDYTLTSILNLCTNASRDATVKNTACSVLDYVSAKVAVSSNASLRSTPFRRKAAEGYNCEELVDDCEDPAPGYYGMLAGVHSFGASVPSSFGGRFRWAAGTRYIIPDLIHDLFLTQDHRKFYQHFYYCTNGCSEELYFASPSYLLAAGGVPTDYAYTLGLPSFLQTVADTLGIELGKADDFGLAVPTVLMPTANGVVGLWDDPNDNPDKGSLEARGATGEPHSRLDMIRFSETGSNAGTHDGGKNLCVARNFACGLNPVVPTKTLCTGKGTPLACCTDADTGPTCFAPQTGAGFGAEWSFIDKSQPGPFGYYVAMYQAIGFGFFEVYDTKLNPQGLTFDTFKQKVFDNNNGRTFATGGTNSYMTVDGATVQFKFEAEIVNPTYDPTRTSGDIINYNPNAQTITITNPALGKSLTLDASNPPIPSCSPGGGLITVAGPVTFPATCGGDTGITTLNVCNTGSGDLCVYNLSSEDGQFEVTEPSSSYPVTVSHDFCFPFQVKFKPKEVGALSSKLQVSSSDAGKPYLNVAVSGTGAAASINATLVNAGKFPNTCPGDFSDAPILNVTNQSQCPLVISSVVSNSLDVLPPTTTLPLTMGPSSTVQLPFRFEPVGSACNDTTPRSGTVSISSNDPAVPVLTRSVSGIVPCPHLNAIIANTGSFGNVCAGNQEDLNLQLMNQGQCNLNITGLTATAGSNFEVPSVSLPLVLSHDANATLPIRFKPKGVCSDAVPQTSDITITSNDPANNGILVRAVSGIEGCPKMVLSPQNLTGLFAFPATVSDPTGNLGCFTDRQISISNAGICPLIISSLTAAPANTFNVINPTVPLTIAPGAAPVPATIRFKPTVLGGQFDHAPDQQTGLLTIVSNDPVSVPTANLCGEPTVRSGIRVLVTNGSATPVNPLKSLTLASKGLSPQFSEKLTNVTSESKAVCENPPITYHLDDETLPPAGTTGSNPKASYILTVQNNGKPLSTSFTLDQCEMKQINLQYK